MPLCTARKQLEKCLGGVIVKQSASNADTADEDQKIDYRIGRNIVYNTETLFVCIVKRYGVEKI